MIISEGEIDYPKVISADVLVVLSQEACDKYALVLKKNGLLIVDTEKVGRVPMPMDELDRPLMLEGMVTVRIWPLASRVWYVCVVVTVPHDVSRGMNTMADRMDTMAKVVSFRSHFSQYALLES